MSDYNDDIASRCRYDALRWAQEGKPRHLIYTGDALRQAKEWARLDKLTVQEWAFIEAGVAAEVDEIALIVPKLGHDLRGALNSILGYSDILIDDLADDVDPAVLEDLRAINSSGHDLLHMINNLVDYCKVTTGQMTITVEYFDLRTAIEGAISAFLIRTKGRTITTTRQIDIALPQVYADPQRVEQIIYALLYAEFAFVQGDAYEVRANRVRNLVQIDVICNRMETAFATHYEHNLMLKMPRRLVESQKGNISFEMGLDFGTIVHFSLPLSPLADRI